MNKVITAVRAMIIRRREDFGFDSQHNFKIQQ